MCRQHGLALRTHIGHNAFDTVPTMYSVCASPASIAREDKCPGPRWNAMCRSCCEYELIRCKCPSQRTRVGYAVPCCRNDIHQCDPCIIHQGMNECVQSLWLNTNWPDQIFRCVRTSCFNGTFWVGTQIYSRNRTPLWLLLYQVS